MYVCDAHPRLFHHINQWSTVTDHRVMNYDSHGTKICNIIAGGHDITDKMTPLFVLVREDEQTATQFNIDVVLLFAIFGNKKPTPFHLHPDDTHERGRCNDGDIELIISMHV